MRSRTRNKDRLQTEVFSEKFASGRQTDGRVDRNNEFQSNPIYYHVGKLM
jgi:hypothetical protein